VPVQAWQGVSPSPGADVGGPSVKNLRHDRLSLWSVLLTPHQRSRHRRLCDLRLCESRLCDAARGRHDVPESDDALWRQLRAAVAECLCGHRSLMHRSVRGTACGRGGGDAVLFE
jgi:hypothetical protein